MRSSSTISDTRAAYDALMATTAPAMEDAWGFSLKPTQEPDMPAYLTCTSLLSSLSTSDIRAVNSGKTEMQSAWDIATLASEYPRIVDTRPARDQRSAAEREIVVPGFRVERHGKHRNQRK